jgi:uncharacterized protein YkwD
VLTVGVTLLGVAVGCVAATRSERPASIAGMEAEVVRRVNGIRGQQGLAALASDRVLAKTARAYSCRMADERFLGHQAPDGSTLRDRVRAAGKSFRAIGENLAMNVNASKPVATAVQGWMRSQGHRDNIVNSEYTQTGVGICRRETRYYFTQLFLRPPS